MKVLLVEDEEFIRDLFKRQLDLSGFTTDAFGTGNDGIAALEKNAYDLVLLDIMLPDINGLQILQTIRSKPQTKNVAVVLLTNLGQDAVIKQGFELGADGYLVKAAYTPDQIVQEVKNIMQKKQAQYGAQAPAAETMESGLPASGSAAESNSSPVPGVVGAPSPSASTPPAASPSSVNLEPSGSLMNPSLATGPSIPGVNAAPDPVQIHSASSQEIVSNAANPQEVAPPGLAIVEK